MLFGVDGGLNNQTFHLLYKFKLPAHLSDSQVTGKQFVDSALTGQKLLVSLIEQMELTEEKRSLSLSNSHCYYTTQPAASARTPILSVMGRLSIYCSIWVWKMQVIDAFRHAVEHKNIFNPLEVFPIMQISPSKTILIHCHQR